MIKWRAWIFLLIWQIFIFMVSESGFTVTLSFPPRFALLFIFPSFLFIAIFIYRNRKAKWLNGISIRELTLFQAFRIGVESLFVWSVAEGVLHETVTVEGFNFDMYFACSAPLIYLIAFANKRPKLHWLKIWNSIGILVLASVVFVFISTLYFPQIYGFKETPLTTTFLEYPYVLVAGFMMPAALFLHFLSLIKLNTMKDSGQF